MKLPSSPTFSPARLWQDLTEWARKVTNTVNDIHYGWDDLRFPAGGINPPGAASDPARSNTTGLLEFSGSADNIIAGVAQMPHSWNPGKYPIVRPHIHIRNLAENTNVSKWKFEYDVASVRDDYANAYGTYTELATVSYTNPNNSLQHGILPFGDLDLTGQRESCCILWKISRLAASDAQDNDTGAIALLEFDIHFVHDKGGTINEIPT